jgi:hypothetical protein
MPLVAPIGIFTTKRPKIETYPPSDSNLPTKRRWRARAGPRVDRPHESSLRSGGALAVRSMPRREGGVQQYQDIEKFTEVFS